MTCGICPNITDSVNNHHVIPQAAGGTDGPTIDICANCHDAVHAEISRLLRIYRKEGRVGTINWSPRTRDEYRIAEHVILTGVKGILDFENSPNKQYKITITVSRDMHRKIVSLKRFLKVKTLPDAIRACIEIVLNKVHATRP
jgi:hypothetical protein